MVPCVGEPGVARFLRFVAVVVFLAPGTSAAQTQGSVLLFSDSAYTQCSLQDVGSQMHTVYVVHFDKVGAQALGTLAIRSVGATGLSYVGEAVPWMSIGNTQLGLDVLYGACLTGPVLVCRVFYMGDGTTPECSYFAAVGADLGIPITAVTCDSSTTVVPLAGQLIVNPTASCLCDLTTPTEATSWGRVKALYR